MLLLSLLACVDYSIKGAGDGPTSGFEDDDAAPDIDVWPPTLVFGDVPVGGSSDPQVITVTNLGDADLEVSGVEIAAGPFVSTNLGSSLLVPGASTTFAVTFQPDVAGSASGTALVRSDDPDEPEVPVALTGVSSAPAISVSPVFWDFGSVAVGSVATVDVAVTNVGAADLHVDDVQWTSATPEMTQAGLPSPFTLAPGESTTYTVTYAPTDEVGDEAWLTFSSDDPASPTTLANQIGTGRAFEGFSTGWYIIDDDSHIDTASNPAYVVSTYGDSDGYWYEPSGAHGMVDSADVPGDFAVLHDYILGRAGAPTSITGPLTFRSGSTVPAMVAASFSYIMCDFWLPADDDPALYEVTTGTVDDGIRVIVDGAVLGDVVLGNSGSFSLADVGVPGAVNTLVVILMDNSASDKYLNDLAFYRDGVLVTD